MDVDTDINTNTDSTGLMSGTSATGNNSNQSHKSNKLHRNGLNRLNSVELNEIIHNCVIEWGQESLDFAITESYLNEYGIEIQDNESLSDEYYMLKLPSVEKRLAMGGVRLQAMLELLF